MSTRPDLSPAEQVLALLAEFPRGLTTAALQRSLALHPPLVEHLLDGLVTAGKVYRDRRHHKGKPIDVWTVLDGPKVMDDDVRR